MTHVEKAIHGTVDFAGSILEQMNSGKNIDIQVVRMAAKARLTQILSVMSMDVAPSPWVTKRTIVRELMEALDHAHGKEEILGVVHQMQDRLK